MARELPIIVSKICFVADAWVVGGAVTQSSPKDYDVAVPFSSWHIAAQLIPEDARPNSFGGWQFQSEGKQVDVWPCDLAALMQNDKMAALWHPKSGVRYTKYE